MQYGRAGESMSEPSGTEDPGMVLPSSDKPIELSGGGVRVGPSLSVTQRQVRLVRPRRWRRIEVNRVQNIWWIECPYCLTPIADERAGDEHLWRVHSDNTSGRAGQMNLLPMIVDIQTRLDLLIEDLGGDENAMARAVEDQVHEWQGRRRRRTHRRWYR